MHPNPALNFPRRRRLYEYIEGHPGIHLRALSRHFSIELGVLRYHLQALRRAGLVRARRSGRRRIYFPCHYEGRAGSSRSEQLLEEIHRSRGVTPTQLAVRCGVTRMLVNYHLQRLRTRGQVVVERTGRTVQLYPAPHPRSGSHPSLGSRFRPPSSWSLH